MELVIAPNGVLQIDNARITHKNFRGEGNPYNEKGKRNFSLIIPNEEIAEMLINEGWRVKVRPPREEGEEPFRYLPVKVQFNDFGPAVWLTSGNADHKLGEDEVHRLDRLGIERCDMDIRPYDWSRPDGSSGRSAYLQSIHVVQKVTDRFAERFESRRDDDEPPFDVD